jgi:uncharacterized repeat protein (TIGR01451 family)
MPQMPMPAAADPAAGPGAFTATSAGNITSGSVPDGTCSARVTATGGAGGSAADSGAGATGGRGAGAATINATFAVLPLQTYSGSVGGGGASARTGGVGGGGTGADAPVDHDGAGGGGRSVVTIAGVDLLVAGGGGGSGAAHQNSPRGNGGAAGSSLTAPGVAAGNAGSTGQDTSGVPGGGQGGQVAAGGLGGVHSTTAARNGTAGGGIGTGTGGNGGSDLNYDGGGGGGAGYTGGGGGASTVDQSVTGAGGGGGSSFVRSTSPVAAATPPTAVSGSAGSQTPLFTAGATGSMRLDWLPCIYDLTVTKTASAASVNAGGRIRWTVAVTNNGPDPMTRGDVLTLTDTLPAGSNAASPTPNPVVVSLTSSGGGNANLQSGTITCSGLTVGGAMPATTNCSRPYAAVAGTPGSPSGGTRGLDVGETLTVVYDQYISNTAPCGTVTNQATVRDRPTQNTSVVGDVTGNVVTDTSAASVTVNCYDLGITKSASPSPTVAPGATITWTITVTNNGPGDMVGPDATAANPLVVTDAFPTTGVGTPTLVSSTGPAGACTRSGSTITCPGSLNAGQSQVLTFTQTVRAGAAIGTTITNTASVTDPRTGDSNDSSSASTQVNARPRITLQKSLGGQSRFDNADQFVMTVGGPGGTSATTSGTGSTITGGGVTVNPATAGSTYTLSEAMAGGSVGTLGQYANSIACTNAFTTSGTVLPAGTGSSFTVVPQAGDNITCTFTNTPRSAQLSVAKTSLGGVGSFDVATTNLTSAPSPVALTTTVAGTPVVSGPYTVTNRASQVQLTETVPAGWQITAASCTDANSAVTGTTGTFGTLAGNVLTVPPAFLEPAADITCTFTNTKLARLVIQKTANGGAGTFEFSSTGGLSPASFSLSPTLTAPTQTQTFTDLVPGTYTVTEALAAPFQLTDLTCVAAGTSAPGSTVTGDASTGVVTATLVAGADYTCTYTNVRDAQVTVAKTSIGGDNTFTFTTTGSGNTTDPAPSITTSGGSGSASFSVPFASGVPTRTVTITENAPPSGWVLTGIACTNGLGDPVGSVALPSVTITAAPGDTFNCNFTNQRLPLVTIVKQSIGGTDAFAFTGGTNGLPAALTLDTTAANPQTSTTYQLAAFNTATSLTETIPANYELTSAVCVDGSGTPVGTTLVGGTITIAAAAVVGGANLTCTFTNTRKSAQVRVDKRWLGAIVDDAVSISSTGAVNNPSLTAMADTANEVDAGTAVTVFAGETLTFAEIFTAGTAGNYDTSLTCTGASDADPSDGLAITAADQGAVIVCTYTNSRIPNVTKTAGAVTGPDSAGLYTATYTVIVDNPGAATTYGALTDAPAFASNLQITGASWTTAASSGAAPAGGSGTGAGPFTLAPAGTAIAAAASHTFNVTVTFEFTTYTAASACGASGTGLFNSVSMATPETTTADNSACAPPPAPPAPGIDIQKSASPSTVSAAGATVNYSFIVTNTGNVTLTSIVVSDPLPGMSAVSCPAATLAPSASTTCTATYTVTQADLDAGAINNTATAAGTPPAGGPVTDVDSETVTATRTPSIDIDKSSTPASVDAAGQMVNYSFVVTNTGNVTLTSVGVTDPLPGLSAVTCPSTTLAPAASTTCTATYTATLADIDAGAISNTATATGSPPAGAGGPVIDTDPHTVTVTQSPIVDLVKSASPTNVVVAGEVVTYSFQVTNVGNVTLTGVAVNDPLPGLSAITCPSTTLAPGATTTCTATYTVTQADMDAGEILNTAIAEGFGPFGPALTDTDSAIVTAAPNPSIDLVKSANPAIVTGAGTVIDYSFVVTNTGNVTLSSVGVSDPLPGLSSVSCPVSVLAPGDAATCTATYTVTQADIDAGGVDNTATATGTPPGGGPPVTDDASISVPAPANPAITIVKSANPATVAAAGQSVAYSFLVTNTGNVTLTEIVVTDPLPGLSGIICPSTTLAPGASTTCTATYTTTQADIDAGVINNTAGVSGTPPVGAPVTDSDSASVDATRSPSIDLAKSATPNNVTAAGQVVNYSFVVTNTGNVTLTSVGVADPLPGLTGLTCPVSTLAPGAFTTCLATYTATQADIDAGAINNTATASGTPPAGAGAPVTDIDGETVTTSNAPAIQIVKTANPVTVTAAGQTVTYTFAVTNTGNVTLTGVAVSDPLSGLSTISCPTTTLAPSASTLCTATYTVTQGDVDAGVINNTATVLGNPPTGPAVTDADSEAVTAARTPSIDIVKTATPTAVTAAGQAVDYTFVVTNTGNVTLTGIGVFDPLPGLSGVTCPVTTLAPAASTTCTATYTTTQTDIDTGAINNTATASGTPPAGAGPAVTDNDSETVTAARTPSIDLLKTATPATVTAAGQTVNYSFAVTNTGNVTLTAIIVSDPLPGLSAINCPSATLAPAATTTCTATYTTTQADIDAGVLLNTASVVGTPPPGAGAPVSDSDSETVSATRTPSISIVKSASPNNVLAAGDIVNYTFLVTNTGNVTLTGVEVSDPLPGLGTVTCPSATLAPAATTTCTATYTVTVADMNAGSIDNTATVVGQPPAGAGAPVSDSDDETVTAANIPAIELVKSAGPTTINAAGETVNYTFLVTNTGNVTLSSIAVADPLPGLSTVSCPLTTLAPGSSTTCTASLVTTQSQIDSGSIDNTASVTGTPPTGPAVTDTDSATVVAPAAPSIDLVKSATPATVTAAGQVISYSFVVTNTGNVTLSGVGVADPLAGLSAVTCPVSTLAPAASTTCSATLTTTQGDIDNGSIDNTATASGTPPSGPAVIDIDSETVVAPASPSIDLVKSASPLTVTAAGQVVTYSFVVTNTGNVTLTGVGVSDPLPGLSAVTCPVTALVPAAATTCTATYTATQGDIDAGRIDNTATASGTPPSGPAVTDIDSETVLAPPEPSITVDKSAVPATVTTAGQVVSYSFLVTNTGNVTLSNVGVSDPLAGLSAVTCPVSTLAPAASTTCTAAYTVTLADVNAGAINNTATASGTPPTGPAVTDTDPNTVPVTQTPAIDLVKSASPSTVVAGGDLVTYSFLVTNVGNVTLNGVAVNDSLPGLSAVTCPVTTLVPGASTTCTATYTVTQADMDAGRIDNTAIAEGFGPTGPAVTDTDSTTVTAAATPSIAVVKSAIPTTVTAAGQTVAYTFAVTNTGNVTLTAVTVSDPLPGLSAIDCPGPTTLAPAATLTCTATYTVTQGDMDAGRIDNTASVQGMPPAGPAVTDSDSETVTATSTPSIDIVKTANPTNVTAAGQTVVYSFAVTNTGNVTLTGVGVADPLPGLSAVTCPVSTLAPSASTTCTATYTTTQADVDAGAINNTATASGTPPTGPVATDTDGATVTATRTPLLELEKSATPNNVTAADQTVNYSFVVTNTGNVTLTGVAVTDPLPGLSAVTCPVTTLAPAASTTCTATYTTTQTDIDAGAINNTATASGTPPTGPAVTDTDGATVTAANSPAIQIVKTATPTTVSAAGQTIAYTFVVTNTGNVTLTGVMVTDPLPGLSAVTCPVSTLAPSASTTCTAAYTTTQADVDAGAINNTATASGNPPTGPAVVDTDDETVTATRLPAIVLVKSAAPTTVDAAGDIVNYTFLVTNTGNVTLTGVGVVDPLPGLSAVTCPVSTLAPTASTTCTATYSVTQADVNAGAINNTATASGTPPSGPAVSALGSETVTATRTPAIDMVKTPSPATVTAAGQTVNYSFVVTNTGNVTLTALGVVDPLPGLSAVSCPVSSLEPGASTTCTASYTVSQADIDAGSIDNVATAAGTPPAGAGAPVIDTSAATVDALAAPSIAIVKSATPNNVVAAGQIVTYSFEVTNTGNVTLTGVIVTDPLPGLSAVTCPTATLAPGDTVTCTAAYTVTIADMNAGQIDNTASVSGIPPTGPAVSDSDSETITAANAPAVQIVKTASPTTVTAAGQTVNYTFLVTNTGNVTLTGIVVTDPLPGLSAVTCPLATLAPGASTTCTASLVTTQAQVDAGVINNTASVTGNPPTGPAVTDTDSTTVTATATPSIVVVKSATPTTVTAAGQTVTYTFDVTNSGNVTLTAVSVSDALPGLSAVSCPATTLAPGASTSCTATLTATQAQIDSGSITNTATATGTPPSGPAVADTDSVTVTAPASAAITLVKTAAPTTITAAGQTVAYSFVVTNTGNVTLTGIGVSDPLPGLSALTCPTAVLAPAASTTCTASYTATQTDVDNGVIDNTATASGTPPTGPVVTDSASATVTAPQSPAITVDKTASPTTASVAGQVINYSFLVTNTGNVTLDGISVSDLLPGLSAVTCPVSQLAPAASTTCAATYTVTQTDIDGGSINNVAAVAGTPPTGPDVTDTDPNTVAVAQSPSIDLVKSANPTTVLDAGDVVTYSFAVTNTGNVTLTSVSVSDPLPGLSAVSCPTATLAPGTSTTCTATYTVTQADVDAGVVDNTATAIGSPPTGPAVSDTSSASVTATQLPAITLAKAASPSTVTAAGQTVTYSFVVTNTGNVTLTSVSVSDPLPGLSAVSCPAATLAPSASITCTATYTVNQADMNAGSIENTATVSGTPPAGPPVSDAASATVTVTQVAAIDVEKTATPTTLTAAGQTVTYTFVVTNTGNVTLTGVGVADPLPGLSAVTCPSTTLQPGLSVFCTATYTVTQADMDAGVISNTATGSGTPPTGPAVTSTGSAVLNPAVAPTIRIDKTAIPAAVASAGVPISYTFVVTNTGNVTLTGVGVTDPLPGLSAIDCPGPTTLAPGATLTCMATYTTTQADADAGAVANTATAVGTPPTGPQVTANGTATVVIAAAPAVSLLKTVSPAVVGGVGEVLTFSFLVTNTGNIGLENVVITDAMVGLSAVSCPGFDGTLATGESVTCTATYTVTQADLNNGVIRNQATVVASGVLSNAQVSSSAEVAISTSPAPGITIAKRSSVTTASSGSNIVYTFVVTNTGNVLLTGVVVRDPLPGIGPISCGTFDGSLDPGESVTCTAPYRVSSTAATNGRITNVATVSATTVTGTVVSSTGTAILTVTGGGIIPRTGAEIGAAVSVAAVLLISGVALLVASRRRRSQRAAS